ncbi:hypothetical protein M8818_005960 [Zalaria obscura]|uniref:Uncharacterized protein n=1 Tax=Zalaria obscura TaxID=2024903 RepID=A0ACC3S764_9PEZI
MDFCRQASNKTAEAFAQPQQYLRLYGEFVTKNASTVSQIEGALRSLTYIIPGRFRDAEIASESIHSGVQLLSLYHDSLLARAVAQLPPLQRPHPSPHSRYTRFWTKKSPTYKRLALTLQVIQYTELLCEMAAKRRGEKSRWRVVVLLEFVKAVCRILLLRLTNSRPLLSPPLPQREVDPSTLEDKDVPLDGMISPPSERSEETNWTMPRTGLSLPTLPSSSDISTYLLSKVLTADDIKPPKALLHRVTGKGEMAELLYIIRPVIYALAMQYWSGKNRKAWQPWILGLSIEYGARQLAKKDLQERAGGLRGLTALEKEELRKRGWSMGWWLMRGAFYEAFTRSWIQSTTSKLRNKPLLDMVGGIIEDYEFLWDQYYFPTATL